MHPYCVIPYSLPPIGINTPRGHLPPIPGKSQRSLYLLPFVSTEKIHPLLFVPPRYVVPYNRFPRRITLVVGYCPCGLLVLLKFTITEYWAWVTDIPKQKIDKIKTVSFFMGFNLYNT